MKKISIAIVLALAFAVFAGCTETEVSAFREVDAPSVAPGMQQRTDLQFEEFVDMATDILTATFVEHAGSKSDGSSELRFLVGDILKGSYAGEEILVCVTPSYQSDGTYQEYNFVEEHDYLLIVEEHIMRSDEYNRYYLLGDLFIPLDDNIGAYMNYTPLESDDIATEVLDADSDHETSEELSNDYLLSYTTELCENSPETAPAGIPYTRETAIEDIVPASEFILLVTVGENFTGMSGTDIRFCTVDEIIKGDSTIPNEILIAFMENEAIVPGYRCCVLINRADGADSSSRVFAESSPNSVIPLSDTETVQEVRDLVATQSGTVTE